MPKYTIYVPHFKADDRGMPTTAAYEVGAAFIKQVATAAGGCTVVSADGVGYWADNDLLMITEEQTVLEVVCSATLWHYEVLPLVSQLKVDLNQRSVFVTSVNVDIIFIP